MKTAYPVVFTKLEVEGGFMAYIPDFEANTQGETLAEAIEMARDAIGMCGIDKEDDGLPLPVPSQGAPCEEGQIVSMVDIDFSAYRKRHETRSVRRNVTLPAWLDAAASRENLNVSAILQNALKDTLRAQGSN